jgi:hypothetical protein
MKPKIPASISFMRASKGGIEDLRERVSIPWITFADAICIIMVGNDEQVAEKGSFCSGLTDLISMRVIDTISEGKKIWFCSLLSLFRHSPTNSFMSSLTTKTFMLFPRSL